MIFKLHYKVYMKGGVMLEIIRAAISPMMEPCDRCDSQCATYNYNCSIVNFGCLGNSKPCSLINF